MKTLANHHNLHHRAQHPVHPTPPSHQLPRIVGPLHPIHPLVYFSLNHISPNQFDTQVECMDSSIDYSLDCGLGELRVGIDEVGGMLRDTAVDGPPKEDESQEENACLE